MPSRHTIFKSILLFVAIGIGIWLPAPETVVNMRMLILILVVALIIGMAIPGLMLRGMLRNKVSTALPAWKEKIDPGKPLGIAQLIGWMLFAFGIGALIKFYTVQTGVAIIPMAALVVSLGTLVPLYLKKKVS